jgi:hypothetical protein
MSSSTSSSVDRELLALEIAGGLGCLGLDQDVEKEEDVEAGPTLSMGDQVRPPRAQVRRGPSSYMYTVHIHKFVYTHTLREGPKHRKGKSLVLEIKFQVHDSTSDFSNLQNFKILYKI